jgi:methylenetetrahydrofolate dehydrogenase (NADP+)/methenyltetrahydrofolate cyclohydrolase/formyltetrahydrofolate synthetase
VVWSKIAWACYGVPETLRRRLLQLTSARRVGNGVTKGSFKDSTIANVAWHEDGSCFLRAQNGLAGWVFGTNTSRDAWDQLWFECGEPGPGRREIADLTYVAIDPHAPTSDTFAFIKKKDRGDAPFVLHFPEGPVYARLAPSDRRLQTTVPEPSKQFRWATVTRSGRPHNDGWELEDKKGEKVKVWEDRSRDWFVVEGTKGKGYCHGSWLRFQDSRRQELSEVAWIRFLRDVIQLVGSSPIEQFPSMTDYVEACTVAGCTPAMADGVSLGVCAHNLEGLLRGSGLYSAEWLKKERVMWHPDRFAQFCVPAAAGQLKAKAEQLFVLYGVCLEEEKKRAGGSR